MLLPDGWRLEADLYNPGFQQNQFAASGTLRPGHGPQPPHGSSSARTASMVAGTNRWHLEEGALHSRNPWFRFCFSSLVDHRRIRAKSESSQSPPIVRQCESSESATCQPESPAT